MGSDTAAMQDAQARLALKEDLARANCRVHQPDDPPLFTREPRSEMKSVHWPAAQTEPLLERIGEQIALGSGGMRRTLRLHNPGLPYGTTHTFWASIQVILPGEIAEAHRHTANAFRFIMKGSGATTTVEGERVSMHEGDLVLTPSWLWHDHEYQGKGPMVWLDVLDISLVRAMHATFFQPYERPVQPVKAAGDASPLVYRRAAAEAALEAQAGRDADAFDDLVHEYLAPNGGPAMSTLGMRLIRLRSGFAGRPRRQVGSKLYYVVRGSGSTKVDEQRFDWRGGDFMAIAPWAWHEHAAHEDSVLFEVSDAPAMAALGYFREEKR